VYADDHLDPDTLAAYVDGRLARGEVGEVDRHIDSCRSCRGELSALAAVQTARGSVDGALAATASGVTATATPPAAAAPDRLGRYVVLRELGRGAMGVVVRAWDPELDRAVAVKVLDPSRVDPEARERLRREARAMAQLDHANVVTIHDVVTDGDHPFVAMALVDGTTLRGYLAKPHPWHDVLATCVAAGRGLAAAHAARLVHRDFKPENVLCSADGRVLVTDFGLARSIGDAGAGSAGGAPPASTVTAIAGTPAYMAPEILRGEPATPLTDQFSFCVTTWEALYGARPFTGERVADLHVAIARGVLPVPPPEPVPARVRRALARGLAADPAARFPSMAELLGALEPELSPARRSPRRVVAAAALAAVLVGGVAVALGAFAADGPTCEIGDDRLGSSWDGGRRAGVERALRDAGRAGDVTAVVGALDRYRDAWLGTARAACAATRVRGDQSEKVLDTRMACLDRGRKALGELTRMFVDGNRDLLNAPVDAIYGLPDPAGCTPAGSKASILPTQATARAAVDKGRALLDRGWILLLSGNSSEGGALADEALAVTKGFDYPQIVAEAMLLRARVASAQGRLDDTEAALYAALAAAERAHTDYLVAEIWIELVGTHGALQHRFELAESNAHAADAVLARFEPVTSMQLRYAYTYGTVLLAQGKLSAAKERLQTALSLALAEGSRPGDVGLCRMALCDVEQQLHELPAARENCRAAIDLLGQAYGPTNHRVALVLNTAGAIELAANDLPAGQALFERSIAAFEASGSLGQIGYALATVNRGVSYSRQGDYDRALQQYAVARELFAKHHPDHPQRHTLLQGIAAVEGMRGETAAAVRDYGEARDLVVKVYGTDSPATDIVTYNLADAYRANHQHDLALPMLEELVARLGDRPESWQVVAYSLEGLAEIATARKDFARAATLYERMIAITGDRDPEVLESAKKHLDALRERRSRKK
jgi:tetratricopeptide (TPR) repeat protein